MSKTDKMPQYKLCKKDIASVTRMWQKCHRGVTWDNNDTAKVLQRCNIV